ncbi:MAG TPA: CPBP family intramembrane glutamic endopeptidase [Gemmataceae bacterium]|nr:CPBP family intramembrane glutamic endopeptidase [Gemmataceae bacterium]
MLLPVSLLVAVAWVYWLLRPTHSRVLPPQRRRAVPWLGTQVLALAIAVLFLCPALAEGLLRGTPFLNWLYGPGFLDALERREEFASARYLVWVAVLAFPLRLVAIIALVKLSQAHWYQVGLSGQHVGRDVLHGVLGFCVMTPVVRGVQQIAADLWRTWVVAPGEHPLIKVSETQPHLIDWLLIFTAAVVTAAVVEELLFRGILQPWFATRPYGGDIAVIASLGLAAFAVSPSMYAAGAVRDKAIASAPFLFALAMVPAYLLVRRLSRSLTLTAIFGTALLFGVAHSGVWPTPISLFVLALGLGVLCYRMQSVLPAMVTHALFNALSFVELVVHSVTHAKGE